MNSSKVEEDGLFGVGGNSNNGLNAGPAYVNANNPFSNANYNWAPRLKYINTFTIASSHYGRDRGSESESSEPRPCAGTHTRKGPMGKHGDVTRKGIKPWASECKRLPLRFASLQGKRLAA